MSGNVIIYIAVMAAVTFIVRATPLTLLRRQIKSKFLQSFLYYVPYVTLAVMTFPAILNATESPIAGGIALVGGIIAALLGADLLKVAVTCCALVLIAEYVIPLI